MAEPVERNDEGIYDFHGYRAHNKDTENESDDVTYWDHPTWAIVQESRDGSCAPNGALEITNVVYIGREEPREMEMIPFKEFQERGKPYSILVPRRSLIRPKVEASE